MKYYAPQPARVSWIVLFVFGAISTGCFRTGVGDHEQGEALYLQLHNQVMPGMTRAEVESILGAGSPPDNVNRILRGTEAFASQVPEAFPDGVAATDRFLEYRAGDHNVLLQFRDDKLVNYSPGDYAQYRPLRSGDSE